MALPAVSLETAEQVLQEFGGISNTEIMEKMEPVMEELMSKDPVVAGVIRRYAGWSSDCLRVQAACLVVYLILEAEASQEGRESTINQ